MRVDHPKNLKNSNYRERARSKVNAKSHTNALKSRLCRQMKNTGHRCNQGIKLTSLVEESERGNAIYTRERRDQEIQ